jgi:hypothetical protein
MWHFGKKEFGAGDTKTFGMNTEAEVAETKWDDVLALLPADLEERAREHGAFCRAREIRSAGDLLRMVLYHAGYGRSTRQTAAWCYQVGIGDLSYVAVWKRLVKCVGWLQWLLAWLLRSRFGGSMLPGVAVRLVDGSVLAGPGAKGSQWRLHVGFDLGSWRVSSAELTGVSEGESLVREAVRAGEVLVADRGYAHRAPAAQVIDAGGRLVVRVNWQNFPLELEDGTRVDLLAEARGLAPGETMGRRVWFRWREKRYPVRLVVYAKDEESTDRERERIRAAAAKKKRKPDPRSLEAAAYTHVVTSVAEEVLSDGEVLELYRFRWQVEMLFRRLKTLLDLRRLPTTDELATRALVYAALILCVLVEELAERAGVSPPSQGRGAHPLLELSTSVAGDPGGSTACSRGDRAGGRSWSARDRAGAAPA